MPGWHEATKHLQDEGKVQVVGIIQEQHPDRARLFMQWKQMTWPIMVDSFNMLGLSVVPVTLMLDETGIIRLARPPLDMAPQLEQEFLNQRFETPVELPDRVVDPPDLEQLQAETKQGTAESWRNYGVALATWNSPRRLSEAIEALEQSLSSASKQATTYFYLGVCYRKRYDSDQRQPGDFQQAVDNWSQALELDPNNYIWRRRIQQYGPRLDKPYPFYDWVPAARQEIEVRGEIPVPLIVEPGGAEFSQPVKKFETSVTSPPEPDPSGQIVRDQGQLIKVEITTIPPTVTPGDTVRIQLVLRPNMAVKAHWNNEVDEMVVWVAAPSGWQVDQTHLTLPNPPKAVSQETRTVEFELRAPERAGSSVVTIPLYTLYYVCEDVLGTCLYRRQDLVVKVALKDG